jgi:hypothetical protein
MKTTLKKLITIFLATIFLQACWTKKCENPDAEHCSWTMVEPGRTADYIFKSKFGDSLIAKAYPPTFGKIRNSSSSFDECVGQVFSSQMTLWGKIMGTEDIFWSTRKYENGQYETYNTCFNCYESNIIYVKDTMKTSLKTNGFIKIKGVQIIKYKGIQQLNINDTIYERIN